MQSKDQVEKIAHALLPGFIPKDKSANELTFHFTIPPNDSFKVWFEKKGADWQFIKYEEAER